MIPDAGVSVLFWQVPAMLTVLPFVIGIETAAARQGDKREVRLRGWGASRKKVLIEV